MSQKSGLSRKTLVSSNFNPTVSWKENLWGKSCDNPFDVKRFILGTARFSELYGAENTSVPVDEQ